MILSLTNFILSFVIVALVIFAGLVVGFRSFLDREKSSPFECGFDPKASARISFSLRFFLLAVVFLIFDIEIIFFFPLPFIIGLSNRRYLIFFSLFALIILLIGLFHEWREGSLDWSL